MKNKRIAKVVINIVCLVSVFITMIDCQKAYYDLMAEHSKNPDTIGTGMGIIVLMLAGVLIVLFEIYFFNSIKRLFIYKKRNILIILLLLVDIVYILVFVFNITGFTDATKIEWIRYICRFLDDYFLGYIFLRSIIEFVMFFSGRLESI